MTQLDLKNRDFYDSLTEEERKKFIKEAMKEAFKEYVNEKAQQFGRWSIRTLAFMALAALIFFILNVNGWQHIPQVEAGKTAIHP